MLMIIRKMYRVLRSLLNSSQRVSDLKMFSIDSVWLSYRKYKDIKKERNILRDIADKVSM